MKTLNDSLILSSQVNVKEYVYTDEAGNEQREVHLVIDLKPLEGDVLSFIVPYPDAERLASLINKLAFYYKDIFPDAEPLELDLNETEFLLRYNPSETEV